MNPGGRTSARRARTQALNQMRSIISTAPDAIRDELRHLSVTHLLERASSYRPRSRRDVASLTKWTLRTLARRAIELEECDDLLELLVAKTAPELVATVGIGTDSTAAAIVRPTQPCGTFVITRMVYDPRTNAYIERRMKEGLSKKEAFRCLKRYIAREVYGLLPTERLTACHP